MNARTGKIEGIDNLNKLSLTTLIKIIREDKRYGHIPIRYVRKHPIRELPKPIGEIQLDVKVLGWQDNGTGGLVYILDAIDTSSRTTHGHVLLSQTTYEIMEAVKRIKNEFENDGIKITKIQTDNAMVFKKNNFVKSDAFNEWCDQNKIIHEFIELNQPEQDGCIERFHRTLDEELVYELIFLKEKWQIEKRFQEYLDFYNRHRYHYYVENKHLKTELKYMIPFEAIDYFKYNANV